MSQYKKIAEKIKEADGILIGASNGLSIAEGFHIFADDERFRENFGDFRAKYNVRSMIQGSFHRYASENEMWSYFSRVAYHYMYHTESSELMQTLYELVKDKTHFVVTSNTDDHFAMAGFSREHIFEIEGNLKDMQCARGCHEKVYSNKEAVFAMLEHEKGMEIPDEYLPKCPVCGGAMCVHVPIDQNFVRDEQWQARYCDYQKFIEKFHGRKLLILEFGIGAGNQMIKAPFMKLAAAEPNAFYITFNKGELYIAPQISGKSMGVDGDLKMILPEVLSCYKDK